MKQRKSFKLTALTAAVLSATATIGSVYADDGINQFFDDSSFDIKLRNVYHGDDGRNGILNVDDTSGVGVENYGEDRHDYAQGVELNFKSGYIYDMFGFDLSTFHALKLDASSSGSAMPSNFFKTDANDNLNSGYGKVGQAFAKFKIGNDNLGMHAKYGRMVLDTTFIQSSTSRATPSSFQGGEMDFDLYGVNFYGIYTDKISRRNEAGYDDFETANGDKIDSVYTTGFTTNLIGIDVQGEYAESKDYVKQYYVGADYTMNFTPDVSLQVNGQYYGAKKAGDLWTGDDRIGRDGDNRFDDDASLYNMNAVLRLGGLELGASYADVDAKGGYYDYAMSSNDHGGTYYWTSRQISDFNFDDEQTFQGSALFNFSAIGYPGFFAGTTATVSRGINSSVANYGGEQELDTIVGYEFLNGSLKGLKLSAEHGYWETRSEEAGTAQSRESNMRFYADYTFQVF